MLIPIMALLMFAPPKPPPWQKVTLTVTPTVLNKYVPKAIKALGKLKRKKK